jgi:2-amino-4-hydroxy-6-hydroxymethyldihydropteridine diphosphokinase
VIAVVLALGSNLGDRAGNLRRACALLAGGGVVLERCSHAWETPPVPADQPAFLNAAVSGQTALGAPELLALAKTIERELGRRPNRHWGPRPIDIDILFYDDARISSEDLTVPHPRIAERGFVLAPLAEAWPGPLPVLGVRALDLLARVGNEGLRRTAITLP